MVANTKGDLRMNMVAEELEQLIDRTLMSNNGTAAVNEFIDGLKSLTFNDNAHGIGKSTPVLANDILNMSLFGDEELSKHVSDVKRCIEMRKPYSTELRELVSYLRLISSNKRGRTIVTTTKKSTKVFSSNINNTSREVTFNMITDRELDAVEQSNVDKINEKVISMKNSMDGIDAKLSQLVKQQSEILGVTPEPTTPDEKIESLNHSVNYLADALDNLCEYVTYSDTFNKGYESATGERAMAKDSMMIATDAAAKNGLNPGDPGYKAFIEGYKEGEADAGDGAAMAQLHSLGMDGITYSDAHDAFFSENGDMYIYSEELGEYIEPRTGEVLCYSEYDGVYFSEDIGLNDEYEGDLYTANGDAVEIYSDEDGDLYDEYGDEVVYSEDADAFFSADGTMLFSEDAFDEYDDEDYYSDDDYDEYDDEYYSDGDYDEYDDEDYYSDDEDIEVVDTDDDGNALCYSAYDDELYYYSAYDDNAYSTRDLLAFSENEDYDEYDGEYYSDDDDDADIIEKEVEVRDKDTGELIDSTKVVEVDKSTNDMILHSEYTGEDYFYSAKDDELFSESELLEFSEMNYDDGGLGEVTNYSVYNKIDNRSDAAITTFSFLDDNGGLLNEDNAVDRYNALQDYLGKTEFDQ